MNFPHQPQENMSAAHQSVMYAYPQPVRLNDEIDLTSLIAKLILQWKLMVAVIVVGSLLSIMAALMLPRVYKLDITLALPSEADVAPFNTNGMGVGSAKGVFKRFYNEVRSRGQFSDYIKNNNYLPKLFPASQSSEGSLLGVVVRNFSIKVDEPLPATKGGIVSEPERITLEFLHSDEALAADLLSGYVKDTSAFLIKKIAKEQKVLIKSQINKLEVEIESLRFRAKEDRMAEILRISTANMERVASLSKQIETSVIKATANTEDRIIQIMESRDVAESLGIIYPTELKEIKGNDSRGDSLQTLIKVNDNDSLPLFLMGTRYLDSLIDSIKKRKNESAFIENLNDLRQQITLIESDPKLQVLKARTSDDPYILELPEMKAEITKLKSLNLDFSLGKVYALDKDVLMTGTPVKPSRRLVVVLGVALSGLVAVFLALVVVIFSESDRNTKSVE